MATLNEQIERAAVELATARQRFNSAQATFDELLKRLAHGNGQLELPATAQATQMQSGTQADRVLNVFKANPGKDIDYDILEQQTKIPKVNLRPIVWKLKKEGKIESSGYGTAKLKG
jgi:hypothetical protein